MPKRSPPDRVAVEAALPHEDVTTLRTMARALGIPELLWDQSPSFAFVWSSYAVALLAEKLQELLGLSREEAQAEASTQLGFSEETIRSRKRRFREDG